MPKRYYVARNKRYTHWLCTRNLQWMRGDISDWLQSLC
jgi:hypothetical protein